MSWLNGTRRRRRRPGIIDLGAVLGLLALPVLLWVLILLGVWEVWIHW